MAKSKQFIVTLDYQDVVPTEIDLHGILSQVIRGNVFHVKEINDDDVIDVEYQEVWGAIKPWFYSKK